VQVTRSQLQRKHEPFQRSRKACHPVYAAANKGSYRQPAIYRVLFGHKVGKLRMFGTLELSARGNWI